MKINLLLLEEGPFGYLRRLTHQSLYTETQQFDYPLIKSNSYLINIGVHLLKNSLSSLFKV